MAVFGYFVQDSRVGLLDTGTAFYLALAAGGFQLARDRDPRWWWFAAGACVLGAWQKGPYGVGVWALLVGARALSREGRELLRSPHLRWAGGVALACVLVWPVMQWAQHPGELWRAAAQYQADPIFRAHDPKDTGFRPYLYWWWLARDWAAVGLLAPVAAGATLWAWGKGEVDESRAARRELALVCAVFWGVLGLTPYRAERYLITIVPLMAVLTLEWVDGLRTRLRGREWLAVLLVLSAAPVAVFHYVKPARSGPAGLLDVTLALRDTLREDEVVVLDVESDSRFNATDFVEFYAELRRPARLVEGGGMQALFAGVGGRSVAYRGVIRADLLPGLLKVGTGVVVDTRQGEWVLWHSAHREAVLLRPPRSGFGVRRDTSPL